MDLLRHLLQGAPLTVALVLGLGVGCTAGNRTTQPVSSGSMAPGSVAPAPTLTAPQQANPNEVVIGRRAGTGPAGVALTGTTRDVVYVYGVCIGGAHVTARLLAHVRPELVVPCDGMVSRLQVYSAPGQDFRIKVEAADSQQWSLLVTVNSEDSRR